MSKEFYSNLKTARISVGISQVEMANRLGVAKSTYSMYESGKREPNIQTIRKIANILGVSVEYLMTGEEVINDRFSEESTILSAKVAKSSDLKELVKNYEKLNGMGKSKAAEQVEMLTKIPEYQKDN